MKNYDLTKPSIYIPYLNMNNLYGCRMSDYLPYEKFKWLKKVDNFDLNSISENNRIGYILEVDLEYPDELHSLHNDIHWLQKNLEFFVTCCQIIVKKLQTNMK